MENFGDVVRLLMRRRGLTGNRLAADIGISPTSVSKILTGASKPKQLTLSRLMKRLCSSPEEEQMVIRAFTQVEDGLPDEPERLPRPVPEDEMERVTRYLEVKSMAVAFENDVEAVFRQTGVRYEKDYRVDPFICDFLVSVPGRRIAVDCKYNVNRDWDRTYATVGLLKKNLPCDEVIVVIPYENGLARNAKPELETLGGTLTDLRELRHCLSKT